MKEELLKGLTEEQIAKLKGCKSQEEILAMAKQDGLELNDEQLEAISGGCGNSGSISCQFCGGKMYPAKELDARRVRYYTCESCGGRIGIVE